MHQNYAPMLQDQGSTKTLLYPSLKIAGAAMLAMMALLGVSPIGSTIAGFFNHEGTTANAFQAGTWEASPPAQDVIPVDTPAPESAPLQLTLSSVEVVDPAGEKAPAEPPAEPVVTLGEPVLVEPPAEVPPPADSAPAPTPEPAAE